MSRPRLHIALALALITASNLAAAQGDEGSARLEIQGPPPPQLPEMIARDADDGATIRATRLKTPLDVDGVLDEPVYESVRPVGGFIQQLPNEGAPATEATDAWIFYDDENIYVSARCWDSHPERMIINEARRDHTNLWNNESFGVIFDTFYDRRNGFFFYTNPLGALYDAVFIDERSMIKNWDAVWYAEASRFDQGWTVEMAIPFKSLRYHSQPIWGINLRRRVRWKNEMSFLTRIPAAMATGGMAKVSSAASLVDIEPPRRALSAELKPYTIGGLQTNLDAEPAYRDDWDGDFGGDLKYGLTRSLTLDLTYNTDFAQIEDDEQQINLTRFSLFYPEKRDFFLEGKGFFDFGSALLADEAPDLRPVVFFSRRIGLSELGPVPIRAGGRVTGKTGPYGVGTLYIETDEDEVTRSPRTSFATLRVKRDLLRRGTVGVIGTRRSPATSGEGVNQVVGADAQFKFFTHLTVEGYYAATWTGGRHGDGESHQLRFNYAGDRYGLDLEQLVVGEDFNTDIGFVPRLGIERHRAQARFSPRPQAWKDVRKIGLTAELDYITDRHGRLETRDAELRFDLELENSDALSATYARRFEFLPEDFPITADVVIPSGEYRFDEARLTYELGGQRRISGFLSAATGGFYDGTRTSAGYTGRVELSPRFILEPRVFVNWVDLPGGAFTTELYGGRISYTFSPRMFLSALVQYNSQARALDSNMRWRWEYTPGSDLYVVYSDGRDTTSTGFPTVRNQTFVVKFTKLFRF